MKVRAKLSHARFRLTKESFNNNLLIPSSKIPVKNLWKDLNKTLKPTLAYKNTSLVAFRTICDSGLIEEWGFICWDRVYTYTGNAHTTEYIFPSSLTYQSIHQYLIETINLSLLEPHFIYRLRWKARRVWGRKQHFKWKDLF